MKGEGFYKILVCVDVIYEWPQSEQPKGLESVFLTKFDTVEFRCFHCIFLLQENPFTNFLI